MPTKETIQDGKATVSESWMNLKNCLDSSKINSFVDVKISNLHSIS